MRKVASLVLIFFLAACFWNKKNSSKNDIKTIMSQKFLLGRPLDYGRVQSFTANIEKAYLKTAEEHSVEGEKESFVYQIEPRGVVNAFSEVEIKCMVHNAMSKSAARRICQSFFLNLGNFLSGKN